MICGRDALRNAYLRISRGGAVVLERRTAQLLDGDTVVAYVHRWTIDTDAREVDTVPSQKVVYPLRDALGSAVLETDEAGGVVGYEELLPYGGSAFRAGRSARDVAPADYRFVGKERDDANLARLVAQIAAAHLTLPDFKRVTSYLIWNEEFPRTASMKVKREELARQVRAAAAKASLLKAG